MPQPTLRRQRTHKLCARVPVQLALKRYKTNINAISPPLHRFYSARATRCEHKRRDKISRKFHRHSRLQPRYRRPSKRPPHKRDRRVGRTNKIRIRRAVWLKFKRPRKNEAVKFSQNPLLKTAQIYRRPLASRGLKIYATSQKCRQIAGLIRKRGLNFKICSNQNGRSIS